MKVALLEWPFFVGVKTMKRDEPPKKKPVKKEKLSQRDLEELMNMKASTYMRGRGGAIRRK
ncbi:hypothetical protein [Peribacillus sp. YIM B13481]|uniref:hypothetical protein n=1 Tax=Peribacillus sp. YIM B13481 TaxID=3366299 RepID=UPI003671AF0A